MRCHRSGGIHRRGSPDGVAAAGLGQRRGEVVEGRRRGRHGDEEPHGADGSARTRAARRPAVVHTGRVSDVADPAAAPGRPVTVRYWAAARAAAGVEADEVPAATLAEAVAAVSALRGAALARVLAACSYLVDSAPAGRRPPEEVALPPGAVVEALPPFAGG